MTQTEKDTIFYKVKDMCEYIETRVNDLIEKSWDVIEKDYDTTLKDMSSDREDISKEDYVTTILDAHMDTIIKTMINIIVLVLTEKALEEKGQSIQLPDPVQFALDNKDLYNIN